jgi:hypothetical protein
MVDKKTLEAHASPLFRTDEVGPFAEFNARNLATAMEASTAFLKGAGAYWGHISAFSKKRLEQDSEIARTLFACHSGEQAVRAQHQFISRMISDYFNEMHALLSIGAEVAKGMADPVENRAEEAIQKMESRAAAE